MKLYSILLSFFCCTPCTWGQNTGFTVKQIDSIVQQINATCISGGVVDYSIHNKGKKRKTIGGGADWFYTDTSGKKLLKAVREIAIESETLCVYYFYEDSLIYLTTSNSTYQEGEKKTNWQGQYYFQNSQLIFKQDNLKFVFNPKIYLETARDFLGSTQIWRRYD